MHYLAVHLSLFAAMACLGLFVGMLVCMELGRRWGSRKVGLLTQGSNAGMTLVDTAVFSLLGLLMAFTFSGAAGRLDSRRHLVAEETNAIGTAWSRIDLLPAQAQPHLRELFRKHMESRLEIYRRMPDVESVREEMARSVQIQQEIWDAAVAGCKASDNHIEIVVLPAMNAMFDITTTRTVAAMIHPPPIIYAMLFFLPLWCSLLAGYEMTGASRTSWVHMISFAGMVCMALFVILDLEFPRAGLIRIDETDRVLIDLYERIK